MAGQSSLIVAAGTANYPDNQTNFASAMGAVSASTTESLRQVPISYDGTVNNLYTYVTTNPTAVTTTFTVRKSGADTALIVSYTSGQTGVKEDNSNSFTVVNSDNLDYEITVPNDAGTASPVVATMISCQFVPSTSTYSVVPLTASGNASHSTDSVTRYTGFGLLRVGTTEADLKYRVRTAATVANFWVNVGSNARTTDTVVKTRLNGADGANSVTYTSGQTGVKQSSNTDTIAVDDDYNFAIVTLTGGGAINFRQMTVGFRTTNNLFPMIIGGADTGTNFTTGVTRYAAVGGELLGDRTTEPQTQLLPRFDFTAKEYNSYVRTNASGSGNCVVTFRDNTADSAMTLTYTPGQTGLKSDTSTNVTITSGTDNINHKIVNSGNGTINMVWIAVMGDTTGGGAVAAMIGSRRMLTGFGM